ncbi:sodium-coupled monocarboxylate transporter 2-like [Haliotis rufescens]|uniref:sodium-coupled monocarboxylate transporter 2-like n=1 Tax=Haliotis rufescens TaxID=6454 RepID=UPI00201F2BD5|nr:sodium-coupled monocarboxylate transporter 2-like [Haliotis rufescens]
MESHTFGKWDYTVFGVMVAVSVFIGIYHAIVGRHDRLEEYFLAGRAMPFFPIALSMLASFTSIITMLGASGEAYSNGIMWALKEIAQSVGKLIDMCLLLTLLKRLNLSSPFQYIEGRFKSRLLTLMVTVASCVQNMFYMSIILFGQGMALQAVTGFSTVGSILVTSAAAVLYTSIGGLKAVIWTDVLQYILMLTGILAVIIKGTIDVGGVQEIWSRIKSGGRLTLKYDFDPTIRHTVWTVGFARIFNTLGILFRPAYLQRIAATKSLTDARRAMIFGVLCSPVFGILCVIGGLVAYGYYDYKRCDPVVSNQIYKSDQVLPFMTIAIFRNVPGMPGLFLAALYSASLSSLSSGLSALAHITWEDFVKPRVSTMSEFKQMAVAKVSVVAWGVVIFGVAICVSSLKSIPLLQIYYSANSITAGPMFGLFYLGAMFPFVNTRSAIVALLVGISFLTWLVVGARLSPGVRKTPPLPPAPTDFCPSVNLSLPYTMTTTNSTSDDLRQYTGSGLDAFYSLSYMLYHVFGFLIVQVVGVVLSLATGGNKDGVNPLYIRKFFCWRSEQEEEHVMTSGRFADTSDAPVEGPSGSTDGQQTESFIKNRVL